MTSFGRPLKIHRSGDRMITVLKSQTLDNIPRHFFMVLTKVEIKTKVETEFYICVVISDCNIRNTFQINLEDH